MAPSVLDSSQQTQFRPRFPYCFEKSGCAPLTMGRIVYWVLRHGVKGDTIAASQRDASGKRSLSSPSLTLSIAPAVLI